MEPDRVRELLNQAVTDCRLIPTPTFDRHDVALITRFAALVEAQMVEHLETAYVPRPVYNSLEKLLDDARAQQSADGWVSVSERLPDHMLTVLVWNGTHMGPAYFRTFWREINGSEMQIQGVTHWMRPLAPRPDAAMAETGEGK
jgi:hypothetical protein